MFFYLMGLGLTEILVIAGIILLVVGGKRLPEIGSGLAKAIKGFKKSFQESEEIDVTPSPGGAEDSPGARGQPREHKEKKSS